MEEKFASEWGSTESEESDEEYEEGTQETTQDDLDEFTDEFPLDDLYCVACNKAFKTEKSYVFVHTVIVLQPSVDNFGRCYVRLWVGEQTRVRCCNEC